MQSAGSRMWTGPGNPADSRGDIYNGSDVYSDFGDNAGDGYQGNPSNSYSTTESTDYGSGTRSNKTKHSARSSQKQQDDGWNDTLVA